MQRLSLKGNNCGTGRGAWVLCGCADVASGVRPTEIGNYLFIDCSYAPCVNANVWKYFKLFVFIHSEH